MNSLQIFNNNTLGLQIKTILNDDGSISVNAEDTARGFGWTTVATSGNEVVRWSRMNGYIKEFGFGQDIGKDDFIPESLFYLLGMKANNETSKKFQMWLAVDIIPSIRKTGSYNSNKNYTSEILSIIKDLPNDEHKNIVAAELLKIIPASNETKFTPEIKNKLNFKNLLNEFMKQDDVFIKRHPQGVAVDKDKLYAFFNEYGVPKNRLLKHLDDEELIFHYKYSRAVQLRINGMDTPIRVVIIKD